MKMNYRKIQLLLTLFGLIGIVSLFLPFTVGISPLMAVRESFFDIWRIAAPAFLSIVVFVAAIRWIISGSFSRAEKTIAYISSAVSAYIMLSPFCTAGLSSFSYLEWSALIVAVAVLLSGSWLVISEIKKPSSGAYCPIIALQVTYISNCLMYFVIFLPEEYGWEIGAWFSLVTVFIYLIQIYLFVKQQKEFSSQHQGTLSEKTKNVADL